MGKIIFSSFFIAGGSIFKKENNTLLFITIYCLKYNVSKYNGKNQRCTFSLCRIKKEMYDNRYIKYIWIVCDRERLNLDFLRVGNGILRKRSYDYKLLLGRY